MPAINLWAGREVGKEKFSNIRTDPNTGDYKIREYKPRIKTPKLREYKPREYVSKVREYVPKRKPEDLKVHTYDKIREYDHYYDVEAEHQFMPEEDLWKSRQKADDRFYQYRSAFGSIIRTVSISENPEAKFKFTNKNRPKLDAKLAKKGRQSAFS